MRNLTIHNEHWPYKSVFRISREARTSSSLIMLELEENGLIGRGEACPYPRYGESIESVMDQLHAIDDKIKNSLNNNDLLNILPAGAARNALDCALLDLSAKQQNTSVASLLGLNVPNSGETFETIVIDSPEKMNKAAKERADYPLLKVKLDGEEIIERVRAVRAGAPSAKIIIDANEAWSIETLNGVSDELHDLDIIFIEQPLPASDDNLLNGYNAKVPLCADESSKGADNLSELKAHYDFINIKLDKTGGLTSALAQVKQAKQLGFGIMVGCMVGTSLAMSPAAHLAGLADYTDIDGPVFLKNDRHNPIKYNKGNYRLPNAGLWGEGINNE